ncbi:AEC family transporter [Rubellicoccus peritrichatus]|uniref:AEC family transporter n=1 Tax=Rubellicoccus peritrichatus TaxID=3080537 RepID=A0AAQ3QWB6_9BACT|nr:AEC family transporter [Puniceicoccus sp. CR14]WOO42513.1 AEC family transporter [Puniceicoccus sp. CR14]
MVDIETIFGAVLPVFLLIGIGWFLRNRSVLTDAGEQNLMRLVVYLLYPCFTFEFVVGNPLLKDPVFVAEAGFCGFIAICFGCLVAFLVAPIFGLKDNWKRRTFGVSAGVYNFGYIAIPVARLLFDAETIGVMLVVNAGVEFAIWTVGVMMLVGKLDFKSIRRAFNPPVIALLVSTGLNFAGVDGYVPTFINETIGMLAPCAIPIGLIMIGTAVYGLTSEISFRQWQVPIGAVIVRLLILPLAFYTLLLFLPISEDIKRVFVVHAAMPTAVFPIVLAKFYGGSTTVAVQTIIPTNLISILTIPLWIQFAFYWLGLG